MLLLPVGVILGATSRPTINADKSGSHNKAAPRVLHVVGESAFGGGARIVLAIAVAAQRSGYHVEVLTTDERFQHELVRRGIAPLGLDVIARRLNPLHDALAILRLYRHLRNHKYDIVHTHTSKAGVVGRVSARLARVPIVVHTMHGFAYHGGTPLPLKVAASVAEYIATKACDAIVTVGEYQARSLLETRVAPISKVHSIPNGVPDPFKQKAKGHNAVRAGFGLPETAFLIVCHGRLAPLKGVEILLQSLSDIGREGYEISCLIVGEGPLREALEARAKDLGLSPNAAIFTGFRDDIADILAAADLAVLPSLREGLSIALLEALSAGVPTVATQIPGNVEVSEGGAAVLVPPGSPEALTGAIRDLMTSPRLRASLGRSGRARYAAKYSERTMVEGYLSLYESLRAQGET